MVVITIIVKTVEYIYTNSKEKIMPTMCVSMVGGVQVNLSHVNCITVITMEVM